MFTYNVPHNLIRTARKELIKDIHSRHRSVKTLRRIIDKTSWQQAKLAWIVVFAVVLSAQLSSYASTYENFGIIGIFFSVFVLLFLPTFISIFTKFISLLLFHQRHKIPTLKVKPTPDIKSPYRPSDSGISANPATGFPMRGHVDTCGNAAGHGHRY